LLTPSESLLAQLRASTSDLHAQLDNALGLAHDSITREKYVAFLHGSLAALETLEPQLAPFGNGHSRSRCALLREDLASLAAPTAVREFAVPPLEIRTEAAAFGARYVIEGSALGGAVLARAFDAALNLNGEALRYLTLHGARLAEHWRAFCTELEQFSRRATPSMQSEACASARAVFRIYSVAFRNTGAIGVTT